MRVTESRVPVKCLRLYSGMPDLMVVWRELRLTQSRKTNLAARCYSFKSYHPSVREALQNKLGIKTEPPSDSDTNESS